MVSQDFNFYSSNLFKGVIYKKRTCSKSNWWSIETNTFLSELFSNWSGIYYNITQILRLTDRLMGHKIKILILDHDLFVWLGVYKLGTNCFTPVRPIMLICQCFVRPTPDKVCKLDPFFLQDIISTYHYTKNVHIIKIFIFFYFSVFVKCCIMLCPPNSASSYSFQAKSLLFYKIFIHVLNVSHIIMIFFNFDQNYGFLNFIHFCEISHKHMCFVCLSPLKLKFIYIKFVHATI